MNKREVGTEYEQYAKDYLEKNNVVILEENFRNRFGEIDLVGRDGDYIVFFEVKFRKNNLKGHPLEAVTKAKQRQICKVADYYRVIHRLGEFSPIRFDVISILGGENKLEWIKNAFYYTR